MKAREIKKALEKERNGRLQEYESLKTNYNEKMLTARVQLEEIKYLMGIFFNKEKEEDIPF